MQKNKKHNIASNTNNTLLTSSSSSSDSDSDHADEDKLEEQDIDNNNNNNNNNNNIEENKPPDLNQSSNSDSDSEELETTLQPPTPPPPYSEVENNIEPPPLQISSSETDSPTHSLDSSDNNSIVGSDINNKSDKEEKSPTLANNNNNNNNIDNNNKDNSQDNNKDNNNQVSKPITEIEMSSFRSNQSVSLLHDRQNKTWLSTIKNQLIPTSGDVNAVFSVVLDNLANIASLVGILQGAYGMPIDLVTKYFIAGPALAVMIGSIALSCYAIYLDYHEKDPSVHYTAIPVGLDAPSTIGLPLLVIGPAYALAIKNGSSIPDATNSAWLVGCTTVFLIGAFKVLLTLMSFAQKQFHPVGKAGALAGIGLALLGMNELLTVVEEPVVGWVSLWILLLILIHRQNKHGETVGISLPFNLSGVLLSALVGSAIYYFMAGVHISVDPMPSGVTDNYELTYPHPSNIFKSFADAIKQNISIAIPYAILVNIGSLTITDSANNVGNAYNTRWVLLIDSFSTIIGSFFGSTVQTTPYIGHTVFHTNFKARSGYSLISGLIIGLGGFFGYLGFLTKILPKPAIIPIFIFIAFEICSDTFHNTKGIKPHHCAAVVWSFFPSLFQFCNIYISQISPVLSNCITDPNSVATTLGLQPSLIQSLGNIMIMAHGFICTSLFWGTSLAYILDNRLKKASIFLAITGVLTFFGVIHSVNPNGEVYLPWNCGSTIPYQWTAAYFLIAAITFAFSFIKAKPFHSTLTDEIGAIQANDNFYSKSF
ncbi:hypothetical protein DDB_G0284579 [Dictyostelium discoideum AX4]|uniref:Uncharacterized protein n=1 Tax=Dictyostelium discoideum TaxID=44689 RepID=Q54PG7_DICDI|nr:hypothetical protein DDB_G0284579 [Dictyostelium discoideum AX4]EAL65158.1 hypothetical protein DDB_G0284579 [Dictyostelium discoideum AX4]|eukprot:XP_638507.1 hypothetical protein DDB_G0284579 [Dictyostelium discoideum AX4]